MSSVLSVQSLTKNYGKIKALNEVSIEVPKGSVFGILGPNGSGKTTLLGIIMDVLKATSGSFLWNGKNGSDAAQRREIGTLLETPNFYHYLTGRQNLEIAARIKRRDPADIDRVLDIVNLKARKDSKFSTYSLGMKQRLAIASTLLGNPDILVFDEPTNGLDPAGIAEIRELMRRLHAEGKTIIMASHILDEVERVCTHVAIIQKGNLKAIGTVQDVLNPDTSKKIEEQITTIELAADGATNLKAALGSISGITSIKEADGLVVISCEGNISPASINKQLMQQGIVLSHLAVKRKSLESRFLEITGSKSDR